MYIVELEPGVWLAPWAGDPGRTVVREKASVFASVTDANTALASARRYRPFASAIIAPFGAVKEE